MDRPISRNFVLGALLISSLLFWVFILSFVYGKVSFNNPFRKSSIGKIAPSPTSITTPTQAPSKLAHISTNCTLPESRLDEIEKALNSRDETVLKTVVDPATVKAFADQSLLLPEGSTLTLSRDTLEVFCPAANIQSEISYGKEVSAWSLLLVFNEKYNNWYVLSLGRN